MRVANKTLYDSIIRSLGRSSADLFNAQKVVTTSKKINDLSDDPVGLVSVLGLRSSLSNINQLERNITMGRSWLTAAESALSQVDDILSRVKELTVQMSSANVDDSQRTNAAVLVDGYLKQIINLANSQAGGRYLFGGTNTGTAPFELNGSETQVDYYGNNTAFSVKIGKDARIEVGKDGEDVFGETGTGDDIFKTLIDLKTSLQNNNIDGIQDSMSKLDNHLGHVNDQISEIGGKTIRLDIKEQIIADLELTYTERKSKIEDADIAEAIIKLNSIQLAYNASLSSSAKIMKLSLVDYI